MVHWSLTGCRLILESVIFSQAQLLKPEGEENQGVTAFMTVASSTRVASPPLMKSLKVRVVQ